MSGSAIPIAYHGPRERLEALIEASQALAASADLPTLLRRILDLATEYVGADRGALFRLDPERGALVASIFHGDELAQIHLERGAGLAGQVALSGIPVRIDDAYADERFDRSVDAETGYRTRSLLVVPLRGRTGDVVGVLEVLNKFDGTFDADDQAFLEAFGAQAAVALETWRLVEERVRDERLAAVGQVVAMLVHDLRGPLSGVVGYASLIEQDPPADLKARCVDGIRRQSDRMQHMVSSILRYVRGEERYLFARTDVDVLLDEVVQDLEVAHRNDALEVRRLGERVGTLRVDGGALRRALDNLIRNAIQAMHAKGTLEIEGRLEGDSAIVEIRDTGGGIHAELRERVFDAFTTHGKASGTGLGLNVVRRVVDAHAGHVAIDSTPGVGTVVRITLPTAGPPEVGTADESTAEESTAEEGTAEQSSIS